MIQFKELHLINFRSWKELHIEDFNTKGLCAIRGVNGSGKSSIRQAIEYLLVDSVSDGILLDELPRNSNTECLISCKLLMDDKEIEIHKYRNSKHNGNSIRLYINGAELSASNRTDTQKIIEQTLHINKGILLTSTIFSQNSISFPEGTESDRKAILYDALDLNKFTAFAALAKEQSLETQRSIEKLEFKQADVLVHIQEVSNSVDKFTQLVNGWETEKDDIVFHIKEDMESAIRNIIPAESITLALERANRKLTELKPSLDRLPELDKEINTLSSEIKFLNKQLKVLNDEHQSIQNAVCPILKESCVTLASKNIEASKHITDQIHDLTWQLTQFQIELDLKHQEHIKLMSAKERFDKINEQVESFKQELITTKFKNAELNSKINLWGVQLDKVLAQGNPYTEQVKTSQALLDDHTNRYLTNKNELDKLHEQLTYYDFWTVGFGKGGIPNLKLEGFLGTLEDSTNYYLSQLGYGLTVELANVKTLKSGDTREAISYQVNSMSTTIHDFNSFSGGERQRIKVADLLAFSELLGQFDILILDEVLELSLDGIGKSDIMDLLNKKASSFGSIFVVTHSDLMNDKFDNVLNIEKTNGISNLN